MTVVTGVSGSGKSTLVNDILYKALARQIGESADAPGTYSSLGGDIDIVKAVEFVDQDPIGKSSRSNPAIYLKAFDEIRHLFAQQQLSKQMGYNAGFFSFNSPGGRCEECKGDGKISIEMQLMANITLTCDTCHGRRFSNNALEVTYRGKSVYDVLEMTVNQAIEFFSEETTYNEKKIVSRLKPLQDVGLGYIKLGQSSSTLSGGENQRVKLASFLSGEKKSHTLFIFDEPTTGLHFHDINTLLKSFNQLIDRGHTIIIIEHNLDVIKCADHIIDLGPEGGEGGGTVVVTGTPEEVAKHPTSYMAKWLLRLMSKD
jgi:excinuclease ABC subunit A